MIKKCKYCGKEFETHKNNLNFCCDECRNNYKKEYQNNYFKLRAMDDVFRNRHNKSSRECVKRKNVEKRNNMFRKEAYIIFGMKTEDEVFNYIIKKFNMRGQK